MIATPHIGDPTITSEDLKPIEMGISELEEDQVMIVNVLTNTLYTDKIAAVLREYGCNAFDANVEAGKGEQPIIVRLPTKLEPSVSIRDHGFGMTEEQVLSVFCKLGRSTKRASNEFTGMLGIGSKAGFAYGDAFMVLSHAKGLKTIYNCYRDRGAPRLAKMHQEPTTEPDGIEVKVPVRMADINAFTDKARTVFSHFKVAPKITNAGVIILQTPSRLDGKGWRYTGSQLSVAVMGNVGYAINPDLLDNPNANVRSLLQAGVELDFNIGELEIAANREGLQYRDFTKKSLSDRCKAVVAEISKTYTDKIAAAPSYYAAMMVYAELFEQGDFAYGRNHLANIVQGKVTWKGTPVTSGTLDIQPNGDVGVVLAERGAFKIHYSERPWSITVRESTVLCENDVTSKRHSPTRVKGFFEFNKDKQKLVIFTFKDDDAKKKFLKDRKLEGAPFTLMSTIPPATKVAGVNASIGPSKHASKHSSKCFTFNEQAAWRYGDADSLWWSIAAADLKNTKGYYLQIDCFRNRGLSNDILREQIKALRAAGILSKTEPIYGFKTKQLDKLAAGKWTDLRIAAPAAIQKNLADPKWATLFANYVTWHGYDKIMQTVALPKIPKGPMLDLLKECKAIEDHKDRPLWEQLRLYRAHGLMPDYTLTKASLSFDAMEKAVITKYPLLGMIQKYILRQDHVIPSVADYISLKN